MDTSVSYQFMQGQTRNFSTNRVKARKDDRFRRIVNNDFNASCRFQRPDVSAFTSDDSAFYVVRFDVEYRYAVFNGFLCTNSLDGVDDDFLASCCAVSFASSRVS